MFPVPDFGDEAPRDEPGRGGLVVATPLGVCRIFLILLFVFSGAHADVFQVGVNDSLTLSFPGVKRLAVARGGILKATIAAPHDVILFGKRTGETTLTVWTKSERFEYQVRVVPYPRGDPYRSEGRLIRVLLEFVEFDRRRFEELGVRWPSHESFSISGAIGGGASGLNLVAPFFSSQGFIHHLAQHGDAKLLARPELYVREGEEATFHSGGEFPVSSSSENYGRFHRHVEWKPFGVHLKVRPTSSDGFHISSEINVEISELSTGLAVEGLPSLSKRRIDTKVDSLDGQTLILSGLKRTRESKGSESVPGIESFPVIGPLFKVRRDEAEATELLVAMTLSFSSGGEADRAREFQGRWKERADVR